MGTKQLIVGFYKNWEGENTYLGLIMRILFKCLSPDVEVRYRLLQWRQFWGPKPSGRKLFPTEPLTLSLISNDSTDHLWCPTIFLLLNLCLFMLMVTGSLKAGAWQCRSSDFPKITSSASELWFLSHEKGPQSTSPGYNMQVESL